MIKKIVSGTKNTIDVSDINIGFIGFKKKSGLRCQLCRHNTDNIWYEISGSTIYGIHDDRNKTLDDMLKIYNSEGIDLYLFSTAKELYLWLAEGILNDNL